MTRIYDLLRKLQPLLPDQVRRWRRTLPLVNETTRQLLEREIHSRAFDLLGDVSERLLLPPPPKAQSKGTLHLGTVVYEADKWSFSLREDELLQNLAIFGRSGAGKTNVAFHLLQQLIKNRTPFLFLDWKRTARHLLPNLKADMHVYTPGRKLRPLPFNPLIPPPELEQHLYVSQVLDILGTAYTLGDGSKSLLQEAIATAYASREDTWPTMQRVRQRLAGMDVKNRALGWKASAARALDSLIFSDLLTNDEHDQEEVIARLTRENTVIELNGLNENTKAFLVPSLLSWIYHHQLTIPGERERLRLVIFIEEAHHVLRRTPGRSHESVMERLLRQCRELGIAIVVVDQHPSLISPAALGNTYASICLNLKDPSDIDRAARLSLLRDEDKPCLSRLPVGHGIVKLQDRWHQPFLVRFPLVDVRKGIVTNGVLQALSRGSVTRSAFKRRQDRKRDTFGDFRTADTPLSDVAFAFVEDVIAHPSSGVRERYRRLGWSVDKGQRIKRELVDHGIVDEEHVRVGRTTRALTRVSKQGVRMLGLDSAEWDRQESIAHAYWKHLYADRFTRLGYTVQIEAPRVGGSTDVLATNANERVAIEIETGRSNVVSNVRNNLEHRCSKIFVVATDETALKTVERQLATEGLLLAGRVVIMLRDLPATNRQPSKKSIGR